MEGEGESDIKEKTKKQSLPWGSLYCIFDIFYLPAGQSPWAHLLVVGTLQFMSMT